MSEQLGRTAFPGKGEGQQQGRDLPQLSTARLPDRDGEIPIAVGINQRLQPFMLLPSVGFVTPERTDWEDELLIDRIPQNAECFLLQTSKKERINPGTIGGIAKETFIEETQIGIRT